MDGIQDLLSETVGIGASDLHALAGLPPMVRVDGTLSALAYPNLSDGEVRRLISAVLTEQQRVYLERDLELDFAYSLPSGARFRGNVYYARGSPGAVFRVIPDEVPRLESLGLPRIVAELTGETRGLVLVTGPTGSGKSTTLAAMLAEINHTRRERIVTVEDPIEFVHPHLRSVVSQRELGRDTRSFARALRQALRQDPDVVLVGEMRDLETISLAVTAAETGHLVLATLHTRDAPGAVDRIVDVFPPHQQHQVRGQLADVLRAVVAQTLVPACAGGRVVACEVLVATPAVRHMIREGKNHQIRSAMQTGGAAGMVTLENSLAALVNEGRARANEALRRSGDPEALRQLLGTTSGRGSLPEKLG